jgi:hypothetical protein
MGEKGLKNKGDLHTKPHLEKGMLAKSAVIGLAIS